MTDEEMRLPDHIRIKRLEWDENYGVYKIRLGNSEQTIAQVRVSGNSDDIEARERAITIAQRLCEGWNA